MPTIDSDTRERCRASLTLLLEAYRMVTGTLLTIFIPQMCGSTTCSMRDLVVPTTQGEWYASHPVVFSAYSLNWLALAALVWLYATETRRENFCIKYFDVDANVADNHLFTIIPADLKARLARRNSRYLQAYKIATFVFIANVVASCCVIFPRSAGGPTLLTLISFVIFAANKLTRVRRIATDHKACRSAFMMEHTAFNTLDADELESETSQEHNTQEHKTQELVMRTQELVQTPQTQVLVQTQDIV